MNRCEFFKYRHLSTGTLRLRDDGTISVTGYTIRKRAIQNKMALFRPNVTDYNNIPVHRLSARSFLQYSLSTRAAREACSVYVYPECGLSRDIIRSSGYKIVRDPAKANCCLVPAFDGIIHQFVYDIISVNRDDSTLCLYSIANNLNYIQDHSAFFDAIKQKLGELGEEVIGDRITKSASCVIVPQCDGYIDILNPTEETKHRCYMSELSLPLEYPNDITVENLLLWRNLAAQSPTLLEQLLTKTNWQEYPATLCTWLYTEISDSRLFYSQNANTKLMLQTIGYSNRGSLTDMLKRRIVEPKDWNLLQDYILAKYNLAATGGFLTKIRNDNRKWNVYDTQLSLVRNAFCVAPLKINTPMLYENILELL